MNIQEIWDKHADEYLEFKRVENKFSTRPDLHAFILLDKLVPGTQEIVSRAEHDQFWLSVREDELSAVLTEPQAIELIRCGVCFCSGLQSFYMNV